MRECVTDRAVGRWRDILPRLGIPPVFLHGKHQACPMCGGKDRARFSDKDGRGTYICAQCGAGTGIDLLIKFHGWDFKRAATEVEAIIGDTVFQPPKPPRSEEETRAELNAMWKSGQPISVSDPAGKYLISRLGEIPDSPCLRFVPSLRHPGAEIPHKPAMIGMVKDPEGRPHRIHRTFLTEDGHKAPGGRARMLSSGPLTPGSAIQLSACTDTLGVAEGIETALSASRRFGVPVWAAMNANNLGLFKPPTGVDRLMVFGDFDANFTGQAAAYRLANRLAVKGDVAVSVHIPESGDWNDALRRSSA